MPHGVHVHLRVGREGGRETVRRQAGSPPQRGRPPAGRRQARRPSRPEEQAAHRKAREGQLPRERGQRGERCPGGAACTWPGSREGRGPHTEVLAHPTYGPTCRSLRHHHHGSLNTGLRAGGGPQKRVGVGAVASPAGLAGAESPQHAVELRIWGPKAAKASGAERPRGPVGDLQGKGASARVHPPPWWASGWPQDPLRLKPPCGGGVFSLGLWPALSSPGA